ncbi:MAG: hypothetical protein ABFR95_11580 [Actinomycetota bacterium]
MENSEEPRYPAGVQPYDSFNGLRIGALAGGVIGILPAFVFPGGFVWLVIGAAVGAAAGYLWERNDRAKRGE